MLLFQRLQNSKTTKFVKGKKYATKSIIEYCLKIIVWANISKKLYSTIFFPFTYGHLLAPKRQGKDNKWAPIGPSLHLLFSERAALK